MNIRDVGRRIAELRKSRGLTQEAFCERSGLDYRHFQKIESGRADLRVETLLKIAMRLEVDPSFLVDTEPLFDGPRGTSFYRRLLDYVPVGIQLNDMNGTIMFSNPAHRLLHGYTHRELIGKKAIWDLLANRQDQEELKRYFRKICEGRTKPVPYFARNRRKDGSLVNVRVDWRYLYDAKGVLTGFISAISPEKGSFLARNGRA